MYRLHLFNLSENYARSLSNIIFDVAYMCSTTLVQACWLACAFCVTMAESLSSEPLTECGNGLCSGFQQKLWFTLNLRRSPIKVAMREVAEQIRTKQLGF